MVEGGLKGALSVGEYVVLPPCHVGRQGLFETLEGRRDESFRIQSTGRV